MILVCFICLYVLLTTTTTTWSLVQAGQAVEFLHFNKWRTERETICEQNTQTDVITKIVLDVCRLCSQWPRHHDMIWILENGVQAFNSAWWRQHVSYFQVEWVQALTKLCLLPCFMLGFPFIFLTFLNIMHYFSINKMITLIFYVFLHKFI